MHLFKCYVFNRLLLYSVDKLLYMYMNMKNRRHFSSFGMVTLQAQTKTFEKFENNLLGLYTCAIMIWSFT